MLVYFKLKKVVMLFWCMWQVITQIIVLLTSSMVSQKLVTSSRILLKRQESGVCPENWILRSDLCYTYNPKPQNYETGKQICKNKFKEAVPATFRSKEDLNFIHAQYSERLTFPIWIGLRRKKEGNFMIWEDGSNLTYENFNSTSETSSDPDRNCVVVLSNGLWFAIRCRHRNTMYCSVPAAEDSCENINCHDHAKCYNTFLSGVCVCNDGYAGDGKSSCIRSPGCPDDEWKEHKGICYRQVSIKTTYEKARLICKNNFNGSDLAKIRYKGDNNFLASSFKVDRPHWIGLRRRTNRWTDELTWDDNSTVMYKAFASNEPDGSILEQCIYVESELRWYENDCGSNAHLFCSIDAIKWGEARTEPGTESGSGISAVTVTIIGILVVFLVLPVIIGVFISYNTFSHQIALFDNYMSTEESNKVYQIVKHE